MARHAYHPISEIEARRMRELYEAGWSFRKIAEAFNRDPSSVRKKIRRIEKLGEEGLLDRRGSKGKFDAKTRAMAIDLVMNHGWTYTRVAEVVGCSPSTVRGWVECQWEGGNAPVVLDDEWVDELVKDWRKAVRACWRYNMVLEPRGGE